MTLPNIEVWAGFTLPAPGDFIFDDATYGKFDTGGVFAVTTETDVSIYVEGVTVTRGRRSPLDDDPAGTATLTIHDNERRFDAEYSAGPYYGFLQPGRDWHIDAYGQTIFSGATSDTAIGDQGNQSAEVVIPLEDAIAQLGRRQFTAWTTTASQLPGVRLGALLDRPEIAFGSNRSFDAGITLLQSNAIAARANAITECQLVSRSDLGRLYVDRRGVLVFRDRITQLDATVGIVVNDNPANPYAAVRWGRGDVTRLLYNDVAITRLGGTEQRSTLPGATILDQGGYRTLSRSGLLMPDDTGALDMANWLVNVYGQVQSRISTIEIDVTQLTLADAAILMTLDLNHVVACSYTPGGIGSPITATVVVDNIRHTITSRSHRLSLGVSPVDLATPFRFDDATLGQFDTGGLLVF